MPVTYLKSALRYAHVRFKGQHAGTLRETPEGGSVFEYAAEFREDIACALPRAQVEHPWPVGLHPFFEHLGPEGWLRNRQARSSEIEIEDDFGILLAYGADCIGAVSIHEPEEHPQPPVGRALDPLTTAAVEAKRTISGVQPKLLVTRGDKGFVPAGVSESAPYIAKFPTDDLPNIVTNEALALEAARLLLAPKQVVQAERGIVQGIERPAILVRRFDRTLDDRKLRAEDFAQILSKPRRRDFSGKYDASFEDAAAAIAYHSARVQIDLLHYFQRIVAYALLGNCDCHLKNFSLLETPAGLRLAPAYDVVNTYVYALQGYTTRFGLRIGDQSYRFDELDRDVLAELGGRLGLTRQAVAKTFADFARKKDRLLKHVLPDSQGEANNFFALFADTVRSSYSRICP